jgi:two-component system NtrC family sensor kinase
MLGGEIIGVMEAVHSQPHAFSDADLQVIETAGAWASTSISNARQHASTERRLEETQALATINQALNETIDLSRLLQLMVDTISGIINHIDRVIVHLYDESKELLTPAAVAGVTRDDRRSDLQMQAGEGIAGQVIKSGKPINVRDTQKDRRFIPNGGATHLRSLLVAPIISNEVILGTISVSSTKSEAFSNEDEHLLSMIGVQAALAIESARLFDETQERARYLEMLNNITNTALLASDSRDLLQNLADRLATLFGADECYIALWDEDRQAAIPAASYNFMRDEYHHLHVEPGEKTITQTVLNLGQPLVVEDTQTANVISNRLRVQLPEHKMLLALPLISGNQKLGAVHIGFNQTHQLTTEDLNFARQIGSQTALAIAKVQLLEAEQNRRQEAETLRDVTTTLTSTLEIDQVFNRILEQLQRAIDYDSASVFLLENEDARIVAVRGFTEPEQVVGTILDGNNPLFSKIRASRAPIVLENTRGNPDWIEIEGIEQILGWMGIPLMSGDKVIGFLTIDSQSPGAYNQADTALAQAFANQAAVALQNARLYESTRRRLAESDTLFYISNLIVDSAEPDVESILNMVVNQLWQNFGYYHVHVYLIDQESNALIANQGSGPIGTQLKDEGYQFTSEEGIVGYAASVGEAFMTNDVHDVLFFKPHPLLPDVSAELAAPLRVRDQILGVLDVQHQPPNIFDEDDFRFLTTLADQIAVVLDKAMLYTQLQEALEKEQRVRAQLVQTAKLAAMGRLVASVAHELNNPLQAIQNALYLVKLEENLSEQAVEDLQVAINEGTRMARLISRLRETYRPVAADEYEPEAIDVLVDEVHKLIGTHLRHNQVNFEFTLNKDIPPISMIRDQIKQVILNLCINAIESMPEGGTLSIESSYQEDIDEVHLKVSDTGPGLTPEIKNQIFEPFFTTKEGGTGLGLAVSFEIAQNHGGNIQAHNNSGPGATFILSLPRLRAMLE